MNNSLNYIPSSDTEIHLSGIRKKAFNDFNEAVYLKKIEVLEVKECFCGSKNFEILSKFDRFGLPFGTQICRECGLVTQTIRIAEKSMPLFYDRIYWPLIAGKNKTYETKTKRYLSISFMMEHLNLNNKHVKIFEVGCGSGFKLSELARKLEEKNCRVEKFGCDYSIDALKLAEQNNIKTCLGGFDELKKFGKADVLILSHVFEHFTDLHLAIENMRALMNENAYVYIEVPGINDLVNKKEYDFDYQTYNVLAHTYNFSLQSLKNVLSEGGFEIVAGNEYVRALFKKIKFPDIKKNKISAYSETIKFLNLAKNKNKKYKKINKMFMIPYFKNLIKSLMGKKN